MDLFFTKTNDICVWSLLSLSVLLILTATLFPYNFDIGETLYRLGKSFLFVGWGKSGLIDIKNNILLFVPLGFSLAWLKKRVWTTGWSDLIIIVSVSFALSYMIEVLQISMDTRYPSIIDVFSNTIGGGLGYLLFAFGRSILLGLTTFVRRF